MHHHCSRGEKSTVGAGLTLREKIGQCMAIGFYGATLPPEVREFIDKNNIGFVVLFYRNIQSIPQVVELTNDIHSLGRSMPWVWTDQEGGTVAQFGELAANACSPMGLAATGSPDAAKKAGALIGQDMAACGIDGVFAPNMDVNFEEDNPIIGIRSFGDRPEAVVEYASAFAAGLHEAGVASCGKHFPGHGGTIEDSHHEIPHIDVSPEYFYHYCYKPFAAANQIGVSTMMTSHVLFEGIAPSIATFSPELVDGLLRRDAGFDGVVFTDCLEMKAVKDNFTPAQVAMSSLAAGVDVLIPSHHLDYQEAILEAIIDLVETGVIPESRIDRSFLRIQKLKTMFGKHQQRVVCQPEEAARNVRSRIDEEQDLANQSVTLLRNMLDIIPLSPHKKLLVIEWEKAIASALMAKPDATLRLREAAPRYFNAVEVTMLPLDGSIPGDLPLDLKEFDAILAAPYSRFPKAAHLQAQAIQKILDIRPDTIIAAIGNPYDIGFFPSAPTYLATYGFRKTQIEALFKIITGQIKPSGRLPVEIRGIFPRGTGLRG